MYTLHTLFVLLVISGCALAQNDTAAVDKYLQRVTGRQPHEIQTHIADAALPGGSVMFGLVQVPLELETEDSKAFVFVAEARQSAPLVEIVRSKPFAFWSAGGRHYVEIVQANSATRFTLQINYSGACTAGFDIFRFARIGTNWVVAGRDSTRMGCNADDQGPGDSRISQSANFLSGTVIEVAYRRNKIKARSTKHVTFPLFPLAEFDPFDDVYGPR